MKVDKTKEQMWIDDIICTLNHINNLLSRKGTSCDESDGLTEQEGLITLRMACELFEDLSENPLFNLSDIAQYDRIKEIVINVSGALDLVRSFRVLGSKKFLSFEKHLKLMERIGYGMASTYHILMGNKSYIKELLGEESGQSTQNPCETDKDSARKCIELLIGLAAGISFDSVILEDPKSSNAENPNPDIIIHDGKDKFGIACKSLSSFNDNNFFVRVDEAIIQIDRAVEAKKIDKGRGIVLIDISSLLAQNELYMPDPEHTWLNSESAKKAFCKAIKNMAGQLYGIGNDEKKVSELIGSHFKEHNAAPSVLFYAHSTMLVDNAPHLMKCFHLTFANDTSCVRAFLQKLNKGLHCQK